MPLPTPLVVIGIIPLEGDGTVTVAPIIYEPLDPTPRAQSYDPRSLHGGAPHSAGYGSGYAGGLARATAMLQLGMRVARCAVPGPNSVTALAANPNAYRARP